MAQKQLACVVVLAAVAMTMGLASESEAKPSAGKPPGAGKAPGAAKAPGTVLPAPSPPPAAPAQLVYYKPTVKGDSTVVVALDQAKLGCATGYTLHSYKRGDGAVVAYCDMMDNVVESSRPSCGPARMLLSDDNFVAPAKAAYGVKDMCFDNKKNGLKREDLVNYAPTFCLVASYSLVVRAGADTCEKSFPRPRAHLPGQPSVTFLQPSVDQLAAVMVRCAPGSTMKIAATTGILSDAPASAGPTPSNGNVVCQRN